jgi:hypothetical protein
MEVEKVSATAGKATTRREAAKEAPVEKPVTEEKPMPKVPAGGFKLSPCGSAE